MACETSGAKSEFFVSFVSVPVLRSRRYESATIDGDCFVTTTLV